MPIPIRPVSVLQDKFVKRAEAAAPDYKIGVQTTERSQSGLAIAAADRWQQAVSAPAALARFKSDLAKAGDEKWRANSVTKGADQGRYAGGVRIAGPAWASGVAPVLAAIGALTLTRGLRRSAQNFQNVQIVADTAAKAAGK